MKKIVKTSCYISAFLLVSFIGYYIAVVHVTPPNPDDLSVIDLQREQIDTNFYKLKNCWLKKSESGLWEMYLEGSSFEMGVINGKLAKELIAKQEEYFISEIKKIVPSDTYLNFLKYFVAWFNRNLNDHVPEEYRLEIFGISQSVPDKYDFVGPKYHRILNYHAAHDIGHALQGMHMVGCTSFSAWNSRTDDSTLIVGRNFDFYVGDAFAENKIICFIKPDSGYKFMMVSWGGMIGAVSGMNEEGLTVTINAGKSEVPSGAATPISILAREMLQYASTIEEAYHIAKKRQTFVAESIMIGSKKDNQTAIIEKTPHAIGIKYPDSDQIICSNHFQSETFVNDKLNLENIKETDSPYRYKRVEQLLSKDSLVTVKNAIELLRNQKGLDDKDIGMGNQKSLNLLYAHHSIVFKPSKGLVWVSTDPWQLGKYVCYDLNKIFNLNGKFPVSQSIVIDSLTIPADSFLYSEDYSKFIAYKKEKSEIKNLITNKDLSKLDDDRITRFSQLNPENYYTWIVIGDYYALIGSKEKAITSFNIALSKEIPTLSEKNKILEKIKGITL